MKLFLMLENEEITEDNLRLIGKLANNKPEKRQETTSVVKKEERGEEKQEKYTLADVKEKKQEIPSVIKKEKGSKEKEEKYTLDDIREKMIEVKHKKGTKMAMDVLDIFGCSKLSDVPEKEYNDLMKIIEEALEMKGALE